MGEEFNNEKNLISDVKERENSLNEMSAFNGAINRKKLLIIIACVIVTAIIALIIGISIYDLPDNRLHRQLDLGQRYLEEMNYEQAVVEFDKAIEIDPMSIEAYMGKAEAYIGLGDLQSALETLQTGYDLIYEEKLKDKLDEVQAQLDQIRQEQRKLEMERDTPDAVKQLYNMIDSSDEDEIVSFVMQNDIGMYEGAYAPSGDIENGIVLEMFGEIDWTEFGYKEWRKSYNIYYGEKVNGSYETQGKWYLIWGMAEHITDRIEYWLYDGEWKSGKPNGNGKLVHVDENYGIRHDNEGYAMQKWETVGTFYNGYVYGDFQKYYEWDIYDNFVLGEDVKDIREYKGTANQKAEIIDGEYIKDNSTGEWRRLDSGALSAGWVHGFCWSCEDITWHDRLEKEKKYG